MDIDQKNNLEIEIKFYIFDLDAVRSTLLEMEGIHKERTFEKNIRFDDEQNSLLWKSELLRLRKEKKNFLTFKSPAPSEDTEFKTLVEFETEVGSFEAMETILKALGFKPVQKYEKWRETFIINDTCVLIDSMPFGNFIELEGEKDNIRQLAIKLGLAWEHRIILNYLAMFDILKKKLNLPFNDVTFSNFSPYKINTEEFLHLFYSQK